MKKPTIDQRLASVEITLNLLMKSVDRHHAAIGRVNERLEELIHLNPGRATQLDQLFAAVNKIAAYAAAMDETKKTMINLTSRRIDKLEQRLNKLRVRLTRLES